MVDVAISVVWSKKMHRCIADIVFQKMQQYGNGEIAFFDRKRALVWYKIKAIGWKCNKLP